MLEENLADNKGKAGFSSKKWNGMPLQKWHKTIIYLYEITRLKDEQIKVPPKWSISERLKVKKDVADILWIK